MSEEAPEFIIVKRRSSHEEEHHGGAWKIAFADFMTAMMAFFLVLWIINATDKNTKTVIARYFNPVRIEEPARASRGIRVRNGDPSEDKDANTDADGTSTPQTPKADIGEKGGARGKKDASGAKSALAASEKSSDSRKASHKADNSLVEKRSDADEPSAANERRLFENPYASLDKIERRATDSHAEGGLHATQTKSDAAPLFQDPFRPPRLSEATETPAEPAAAPSDHSGPREQKAAAGSRTEIQLTPTHDSDSRTDAASLLIRNIETRIAALHLDQLPGLEIKTTPEGVLISLTDNLKFSMFAVGSAEPQSAVVRAVGAIAAALRTSRGKLIVRGHTDARPYRSAAYDNWRLSSARAQMTYYMLTRAGVPDSRFDRIEGYADKNLRFPDTPLDPRNRRIEILIGAGA